MKYTPSDKASRKTQHITTSVMSRMAEAWGGRGGEGARFVSCLATQPQAGTGRATQYAPRPRIHTVYPHPVPCRMPRPSPRLGSRASSKSGERTAAMTRSRHSPNKTGGAAHAQTHAWDTGPKSESTRPRTVGRSNATRRSAIVHIRMVRVRPARAAARARAQGS